MLRFLALAGLVACGTTGAPSSPPPVVEMAPITAPPVVALNQRAADTSLDRAARCSAVFELFAKHLAPGVTAPAAAAVLTERSWIVLDLPITEIGGEVPLDVNFDDSLFVVHCLATPNADLGGQLWSDWVIYARTAGHAAPTLRAFLDAGADVRLLEYALMSPDGRIDRHRPAM